ncbi:hypothetical protein [Sphaerisporangium perillae]|uniref:hypothetical protein n=1 Tax=Sphaerisporangium perillae TaxID=2935860 RepID=UPI00200DA3BE|nr:hypothetical protein [Sphaerisporangium perillae]
MSIDKETPQEAVSVRTATAVDDRPVRTARGTRAVTAPPRPERTVRRPAPSRPPRRAAAPAPPVAEAAEAPPRATVRRGAPRMPFVLLVVGLLCGGLVSLLLLNVVLATDSYRANDLVKSTQRLRDEAAAARTKVLLDSQPERLAEQARKLGEKPDKRAPQVLVIPPEGQGAGRAASQNQAPAGTGAQGAGVSIR